MTPVFLLLCSGVLISAVQCIPTSGIPSIPPQDQILPPFTANPAPSMYFQWSIGIDEPSRDQYLIGTFNFTDNYWVAIGLRSNRRMNGHIVMCYINSTSNEGDCDDFFGKDYTISYWDPSDDADLKGNFSAVTILRASSNSQATSIRFMKKVFDGKTNESIANMDGPARVIFARGKWPLELSFPKQHESDDNSAFNIHFTAGSVTPLTSTIHLYVIYASVGVLVVGGVLGKIIRSLQYPFHHRTRLFVALLVFLVFFALVFLYVYTNYRDYKATVVSKALARAFGDGAAMALCATTLPIGRAFFQEAGISVERTIKYHMIAAWTTVFFAWIHGGLMFYYYGMEWIKRWRDKDEISKLPGVFAAIFLTITAVVGLLRHVMGFRHFRKLHYLYGLGFFFACCHYPKVVFLLLPGLGFLSLSVLYKKLIAPAAEHCGLRTAVADAASGTILIEFTTIEGMLPGSWVYLKLPDVSSFETHPFSVARLTIEANDRSTTGNPADSQKTEGKSGVEGDPSHAADTDMQHVYRVKLLIKNTMPDSDKPSSWTGRLFQAATSGAVKSYCLDGVFGLPEVDPAAHYNFFLAAGGVGISGVSFFFQALLDAGETFQCGSISRRFNVWLLWVVRDPTLLHLMAPDIAEDLTKFERHIASPTAQTSLEPRVLIYVTGSRPKPPTLQGGNMDNRFLIPKCLSNRKHVEVKCGGRPNLPSLFSEFQQRCEKNCGEIEGSNTAKLAALYCAGPKPFRDAVLSASQDIEKLTVCAHIESGTI